MKTVRPMKTVDIEDGWMYAIEYLERAFSTARLTQSADAPKILKAINALKELSLPPERM